MAFFTADQIAVLSAGAVRVAFLVEFGFTSQTMRLWNGEYALTSGGETWMPMKGHGKIDGLSVGSGETAANVEFTLSGVPDAELNLLALALEETPEANQRSVRVYLQLFDADWQPVGVPLGIWWGVLQPPRVQRSPQSEIDGSMQSISITAENAFFNRARPPAGRYTDRDQQKRSDGDTFFQFMPGLSAKTFIYPSY